MGVRNKSYPGATPDYIIDCNCSRCGAECLTTEVGQEVINEMKSIPVCYTCLIQEIQDHPEILDNKQFVDINDPDSEHTSNLLKLLFNRKF